MRNAQDEFVAELMKVPLEQAARVDRLAEEVKQVLRAASVVGRSFLYRLLREVVEAVIEIFPSERVGVRLSPNGVFNDMGAPDYRETFHCTCVGIGNAVTGRTTDNRRHSVA